jgi:hypothetical protein
LPRDQLGEDVELLAGQRQQHASPAHLVPAAVHLEVTAAQQRRHPAADPPAQPSHPRLQLLDGERLNEVVVAVLEPGDAVGDGVTCGEEQHRRRRPACADVVQRVAGGQHPVEHRAVVGVHGECLVGGREVADRVDGEAGGTQ